MTTTANSLHPKARVLTLVASPPPIGEVNGELVEVMRDLLASARSGEMRGLACVVYVREGRFYVDVHGIARDDPYQTRGHLLCLDDELARECARQKDT